MLSRKHSGSAIALISTSVRVPNIENSIFLKIFPNPNSGNFNIRLEPTNSDIGYPAILEVYNELGQKVYALETERLQDISIYEIFLNENPSGIYFIKVITRHHVLSERVILN